MHTVPLTPERLAELEELARRRGKSTADALDDYLEWERQDYREALEGIREGNARDGWPHQTCGSVPRRVRAEAWSSALN
jgi:hypothetical protein